MEGTLRRNRLLRVYALMIGVCCLQSTSGTLDEELWPNMNLWGCAESVLFSPFSFTGPYNAERTEEDYMSEFADLVSRELARIGIGSMGVKETYDSANEPDVLITGRFITIDQGSRAKRALVGFGAGASKCDVELTAIDVKTGATIFLLRHAKMTHMFCGADCVSHELKAIARDIGKQLRNNYKQCDRGLPLNQSPEERQNRVLRNGTLTLESNVDNADVYIDGDFIGNSPLDAFAIEDGNHVVRFEKQGYTPWARNIAVSKGNSTRVFGTLERISPQPQKTTTQEPAP
ncbi:MAG: PEGA domain-containing protein [Chitinivibrionales bacterium]|nr:PEGA domain-containing protein [Chitinivibrionales bacterium]